MYAVTLNELKAILKVSAQERQSGTVNETSVEPTVHYVFQEVKKCKRNISNNTLQAAKMSTKPVQTLAPVKMPPKAALTHNFLAPLRTTEMDIETAEEENMPLEQEAPSSSDDFYHNPHSIPSDLEDII
jgi:hypothetical protein